MILDVEQIIDTLQLKPFGSLGWLTNKEPCPYCDKSGKWGIMINTDGGVFHCWKCQNKIGIRKFLQKLDLSHLCTSTYENKESYDLQSLVPEEEEKEEGEVKKVKFPIGCKMLDIDDEYLKSRRFMLDHYIEFNPMYTDSPLEPRLHNYIIFPIYQKGEPVAWLARSRHSKEWHEKDLQLSKKEGRKPSLRYENSRCDFGKILGGYDTIPKNVDTLFIVEGLFDKIGLDNIVLKDKSKKIGVVFTFGKKVSKDQLKLIQELNPSEVILMYDNDAMMDMKGVSVQLSQHFDTYIAYIDNPSIDPGDMTDDYYNKIINKLYTPIDFFTTFMVGLKK